MLQLSPPPPPNLLLVALNGYGAMGLNWAKNGIAIVI